MADTLVRPSRRARSLSAGDRGGDRPDRPPLLPGLDLRLDRRADAGLLDRRRTAHRPAPDQGLAADHRRAARLRPAARGGGWKSLRDPLERPGARRQDPGPRAGADDPAAGRPLHAGPPALLGLRGLLVLVLALLRHAVGGGRDLALPLPVVPSLRRLHRGAGGDGPRHLRDLPGGTALARRRPRLHPPHLPDHPRRGEQPAGAEGRRDVPEGNRLGQRRGGGALAACRVHDADLPLPVAPAEPALAAAPRRLPDRDGALPHLPGRALPDRHPARLGLCRRHDSDRQLGRPAVGGAPLGWNDRLRHQTAATSGGPA